MKGSLSVAICVVGFAAAASVYWRGPAGEARKWSATDNSASGSGGYYWNTKSNGSGTWQQVPVNENAHVNNGGTAVIDGTVGVVDGVQKLVLCFDASNASCVRIDPGGVLTNAIAYIGHGGTDSSGAHFHVNGGEAWLGRGDLTNEGFHLPSTTAYRASGSEYFATVSGGLLDVSGKFTVGARQTTNSLNHSTLTVEGGAVTSHCNVAVGSDSETSLNSGLINITGGEMAVVSSNTLSLYHNARLHQTGGSFVTDTLTVKRGTAEFLGGRSTVGFLKFSTEGSIVVSDEGNLTAGFNLGNSPSVTAGENSLTISNGTVKILNATSSVAFLQPVRPFYLRMLGGTVNLTNLYVGVGASGLLSIELDGGTFKCGKMSTYGQPFYLRHTGGAVAEFDEFPLADNWNKNLCASNCLVDHVFTEEGLKPLWFAKSNRVFGRNSLRPQGGFQIVATNRIALYRLQLNDSTLGLLSLGSLPDETLWDSFRFTGTHYWGSELRNDAAVGGVGSVLAAETIQVGSRPNGYVPLPSVKTNSLKRMTVELGVVPMSATLAELAADMVSAGYTNVTSNAGENKLVFDVPITRLPNQSSSAAAVFDFTKPVCPDKFVEGPMDFNIMTNAVVSSIRISLETNTKGITVLFR